MTHPNDTLEMAKSHDHLSLSIHQDTPTNSIRHVVSSIFERNKALKLQMLELAKKPNIKGDRRYHYGGHGIGLASDELKAYRANLIQLDLADTDSCEQQINTIHDLKNHAEQRLEQLKVRELNTVNQITHLEYEITHLNNLKKQQIELMAAGDLIESDTLGENIPDSIDTHTQELKRFGNQLMLQQQAIELIEQELIVIKDMLRSANVSLLRRQYDKVVESLRAVILNNLMVTHGKIVELDKALNALGVSYFYTTETKELKVLRAALEFKQHYDYITYEKG